MLGFRPLDDPALNPKLGPPGAGKSGLLRFHDFTLSRAEVAGEPGAVQTARGERVLHNGKQGRHF